MLHYFNPGHETAVLNASPYYTPAVNQVKMQYDLGFLPAWYAGSPNDFVWVEDDLTKDFIDSIQSLSHVAKAISINDIPGKIHLLSGIKVSPWGISPQSIRFFKNLNNKYELNLQLPEWKEEYIQLCSRQTAKNGMDFIVQHHPEISKDIVPQFYTTIEDIENVIISSSVQLLAKAPYSSSGRGLLWLPPGKLHQSEKQIISGILKKQSTISLEKVLNKKVDFAMLFYSDGSGNVDFTGLSLFETDTKGTYDKNIVTSQNNILQKLQTLVDISLLERIKHSLISFLNQSFGFLYHGYIGIDMMIYAENGQFRLHPCVEINMRKTMGVLAFKLQEYFFSENATGYFKIDFSNKSGELLQKHTKMKETYPAKFSDDKIQSGYLSLCPVNENSKYRAYIQI